ncbi:MAG TPA: hypothetical protein VGT04_04825 [Acidobacteriaceae bacterium]|nr:hypothetical protein [Acidobacteriaceae bacterium]
MAALIVGGLAWYKSRPSPWDKKAIIASKPPGFGVDDDGKAIDLVYTLENTSQRDFELDSTSPLQIFEQLNDGTLLGPLADKTILSIHFPVSVPAGQKTAVLVSMPENEIPARTPTESDTTYHENIRKFLNVKEAELGGFVIFDSKNRDEVDLPKWLSKPPTPASLHH